VGDSEMSKFPNTCKILVEILILRADAPLARLLVFWEVLSKFDGADSFVSD